MVMRLNFNQVFRQNSDGSLASVRSVSIGGVVLGPNVTFSRGVKFGNIDLTDYIGWDLEADEENGVLVLKTLYPPGWVKNVK